MQLDKGLTLVSELVSLRRKQQWPMLTISLCVLPVTTLLLPNSLVMSPPVGPPQKHSSGLRMGLPRPALTYTAWLSKSFRENNPFASTSWSLVGVMLSLSVTSSYGHCLRLSGQTEQRAGPKWKGLQETHETSTVLDKTLSWSIKSGGECNGDGASVAKTNRTAGSTAKNVVAKFAHSLSKYLLTVIMSFMLGPGELRRARQAAGSCDFAFLGGRRGDR